MGSMTTIPDLAERDRRLARVRQAMVQANLDGLLVAGKGHWWTGRGYFRYFTDFHIWGHDGLICIPREGEPFLAFSSYAVAERIAARGWITDTRGDVYIAPHMAAECRARGLGQSRIGVAGHQFILGAGTMDLLAAEMPAAELVVADDLLNRIRAVKSELEMRQENELWDLAKSAMERFVTVLQPGATQRDLAAEACRVAWAGGARDILVFIGERPGEHDPPQDIPLRCDDIVRYHMEILGPSGHWCELTVNCAFREPTTMERKLMGSELCAFARIRAAARPGVKLSRLARIFEQTLEEQGWVLGSPTTHFDFHGQGMDTIEYPWFAAAAGWGSSQDWPLAAGMVLSYHPRRNLMNGPRWSTGINEDIRITPTGAETFSGDWSHHWRLMG